ncbi:DNA circularization protein [Sphingomonas sp. Leaf25]|uniref:DNA circularization protein n=1 Tax=Sphingomonas sp. Leaf25 TaxID=1735692 RepID=UPI0006F75F72|nr:DNA circularization N-terminal domain-containing protein [Sphingomonas sp. Leaf25]KQN00572.1 hypothetical protein ASE78_05665 [Sphingomonas sp. Leaf25]
MALFAGKLLPASFRGAPFAVLQNDTSGGRRIALHQYPGRDQPWAEDMGRAPRQFRFRGFIVDGDVVFVGGPVQLQRVLLLAALEKRGPGVLTHPTLGVLNVSVVRFSLGEDLGAGRMSSVEIEFVEAGKKTYPSLLSSSAGLFSAANLCKVALAVDAIRAIALLSSLGGRRRDLSNTAALWSSQVVAAGRDATALQRLAAQQPGAYGRFAGGGNTGLGGQRVTTIGSGADLSDLVAIASRARVALGARAAALAAAVAGANLAYATGIAPAVIALVDTLVDACADPADAIRLLASLAAFVPLSGSAQLALGGAVTAMVRRAIAAALVRAAGEYQPSSSNDAAAMIALIGGAIGSVADEAADAGDDESFAALRGARAAVVADLRRRGATLAQITTFAPGVPLPALRLAQRYYRDPTRADQLVGQTSIPHPLFMPVAFEALAA